MWFGLTQTFVPDAWAWVAFPDGLGSVENLQCQKKSVKSCKISKWTCIKTVLSDLTEACLQKMSTFWCRKSILEKNRKSGIFFAKKCCSKSLFAHYILLWIDKTYLPSMSCDSPLMTWVWGQIVDDRFAGAGRLDGLKSEPAPPSFSSHESPTSSWWPRCCKPGWKMRKYFTKPKLL